MLNRFKQIENVLREKSGQPGNCKIHFLPVECLAADPSVFSPTGEIIVWPIITAKFNKAEFLDFDSDYNEIFKEDDAGDYFDITVNGFCPFETKSNNNILKQLKYHRYIVLVTTPGRLIKWLGTKENPVKMLQSFGSGTKMGTASPGTPISFVWKSEEKPKLLAVEIPPEAVL